ncbi:MAG: EAL domain-containing protein, partial [Wenzhouxiangellaceae bacterium]
LDQLVLWHAQGIEVGMAVNVSAQNLMNPGFGQMVKEQLARRDIDGNWLELEVTENALIQNIERILELLHGLSGMNVVISIDDFGTGYSSLQYMKDLPVTVIKIDQVFVMPLNDDPGAAHIVSSTIDLGHRLDMQVVAEGVETAGILEMLDGMGCDMAQGYHIARPMDATAFEEWHRANKGRFAVSGDL